MSTFVQNISDGPVTLGAPYTGITLRPGSAVNLSDDIATVRSALGNVSNVLLITQSRGPSVTGMAPGTEIAKAPVTIYLDPLGNDSNDGTTQARAVKTVPASSALRPTTWRQRLVRDFALGTYGPLSGFNEYFDGGPNGSRAVSEVWIGKFVDQVGSQTVLSGSTTTNLIGAPSPALRSGVAAGISAVAGFGTIAGLATVVGLTNMTAADVGKQLMLGLATNPGNNGTFTIATFISPTSVKIRNAQAVVENTSLLYWQDSYRYAFLRLVNAVAANNRVQRKAVRSHGVEADNGVITAVAVANLVDNDNFAIPDKTLTGTVTLTNGSTAVTGTGTAFLSEVAVGKWIKLAADSASSWGKVATVTDDTNITLSATYGGAGGAGTAACGIVCEFKVTGGFSPVAGRTLVDVSALTTAAQVAAAIVTAINALAPTTFRVRGCNTVGYATVQLQNMIPGSAGNAALTESVADAGFTVSGFTNGVGNPLTTFTTNAPYATTPTASTDVFVVEQPGVTIQFALTAGVTLTNFFSRYGTSLAFQGIRFVQTTAGNLGFSGILAGFDGCQFDLSGLGALQSTAGSTLGVPFACFNDPTNPLVPVGVNGAGASVGTIACAYDGTVTVNAVTPACGIAGAWLFGQVRLTCGAGGVPSFLSADFLRTTAVCSSNTLFQFAANPAFIGRWWGAQLSTDSALLQLGSGAYMANGAQLDMRDGPGYGVELIASNHNFVGTISGRNHVKSGFRVNNVSNALIDQGGTTTLQGNAGDFEFGHETSPLIQSYATVRTADGTGTKGYADTHLNRVDVP